MRFQANNKINAWDATPAVAVPASNEICAGPQVSIARAPVGSAPKIITKAARPISETTLFKTGAYMYGPNALLAFSTSPRIE